MTDFSQEEVLVVANRSGASNNFNSVALQLYLFSRKAVASG